MGKQISNLSKILRSKYSETSKPSFRTTSERKPLPAGRGQMQKPFSALPKAPFLTRLPPSTQTNEKSRKTKKKLEQLKCTAARNPGGKFRCELYLRWTCGRVSGPQREGAVFGSTWLPRQETCLQHPPTLHTAHSQHRHLCDANLLNVLGNVLGLVR